MLYGLNSCFEGGDEAFVVLVYDIRLHTHEFPVVIMYAKLLRFLGIQGYNALALSTKTKTGLGG